MSHPRRTAVVLVAVLGITACSGTDIRTSPPPTTASPGTTAAPAAKVTWTALRESPLANRTGFTHVWTGTELLICCGATRAGSASADAPQAAAYNPATDAWRPIASPPAAVENWGAITMVGNVVYFFDGGTAPWSYAAYDIAADSWRTIPPPPQNATRAPNSRLGPSAWTGKEIVAPISTPPAAQNDLVLVAFDPATSSWRTLPAPPTRVDPTSLAYDNGRLTLLGEVRDAADQGGAIVSSVLDMSTNQWNPPERTPIARRDAVVTGSSDRMVAWDVSGAVRVQQNGEWRELPSIPYPEDECGWKGTQLGMRLVLWRCTQQGAVLDLDKGMWSTLPPPPAELQDANITVANGRLLLWGATGNRLQPYALSLQ